MVQKQPKHAYLRSVKMVPYAHTLQWSQIRYELCRLLINVIIHKPLCTTVAVFVYLLPKLVTKS